MVPVGRGLAYELCETPEPPLRAIAGCTPPLPLLFWTVALMVRRLDLCLVLQRQASDPLRTSSAPPV